MHLWKIPIMYWCIEVQSLFIFKCSFCCFVGIPAQQYSQWSEQLHVWTLFLCVNTHGFYTICVDLMTRWNHHTMAHRQMSCCAVVWEMKLYWSGRHPADVIVLISRAVEWRGSISWFKAVSVNTLDRSGMALIVAWVWHRSVSDSATEINQAAGVNFSNSQ